MWTRATVVTAALGLGLALASGGCGFLENRFKSCEDVRIDLINDDQTLAAYHMLGEDEDVGGGTLLQSGQARRITMCLDKGYRKKFSVFTPADTGHPVATVHCVAGRTSYETIVARVRWTPIGLRCEEW